MQNCFSMIEQHKLWCCSDAKHLAVHTNNCDCFFPLVTNQMTLVSPLESSQLIYLCWREIAAASLAHVVPCLMTHGLSWDGMGGTIHKQIWFFCKAKESKQRQMKMNNLSCFLTSGKKKQICFFRPSFALHFAQPLGSLSHYFYMVVLVLFVGFSFIVMPYPAVPL